MEHVLVPDQLLRRQIEFPDADAAGLRRQGQALAGGHQLGVDGAQFPRHALGDCRGAGANQVQVGGQCRQHERDEGQAGGGQRSPRLAGGGEAGRPRPGQGQGVTAFIHAAHLVRGAQARGLEAHARGQPAPQGVGCDLAVQQGVGPCLAAVVHGDVDLVHHAAQRLAEEHLGNEGGVDPALQGVAALRHRVQRLARGIDGNKIEEARAPLRVLHQDDALGHGGLAGIAGTEGGVAAVGLRRHVQPQGGRVGARRLDIGDDVVFQRVGEVVQHRFGGGGVQLEVRRAIGPDTRQEGLQPIGGHGIDDADAVDAGIAAVDVDGAGERPPLVAAHGQAGSVEGGAGFQRI
ncbi:major ampullate spidroin 1 [Nitrospirillum viridazoti Y2]|nr:major ampullate spidroin 1 [Nitrospirillum amazonense Y2]